MTNVPSIWASGQIQPKHQRSDLYVKDSMPHPGKMWPAIAHEAISRHSSRGDTVLDPMCGIGTTLVEAIKLERHAVGIECEKRWALLAAENTRRAREHKATSGAVMLADARTFATILTNQQVDMILTSPPYGAFAHGNPTKDPRGIRKANERYAPPRQGHQGQLATTSLDRLLDGLRCIFDQCRTVLRPGGRMVVTARPFKESGVLWDFPSLVIYCAHEAGFRLLQRDVALLGRWDGSILHPHATFFHIHNSRTSHHAGETVMIRAHEDVLIFTPQPTTNARNQP